MRRSHLCFLVVACVSMTARFVKIGCCAGESQRLTREDRSATYSYLLDRRDRSSRPEHKAFWRGRYETVVQSRYGVYACDDVASAGLWEWKGVSRLFIVARNTNDVHLIAEDEKGNRSVAYRSTPGSMSDTHFFFGPEDSGLHFLYEVVAVDLHAVFSPYGIQKRMIFRPVEQSFNVLPDNEFSPEESFSDGSLPPYTNYQHCITTVSTPGSKQRMLVRHELAMRSRYGVYVWDDVESAHNWQWASAERIIFFLLGTNDIYLVEERANKQFWLSAGSYPGQMTERFLRFGLPSPALFLYSVREENLNAVFAPILFTESASPKCEVRPKCFQVPVEAARVRGPMADWISKLHKSVENLRSRRTSKPLRLPLLDGMHEAIESKPKNESLNHVN